MTAAGCCFHLSSPFDLNPILHFKCIRSYISKAGRHFHITQIFTFCESLAAYTSTTVRDYNCLKISTLKSIRFNDTQLLWQVKGIHCS